MLHEVLLALSGHPSPLFNQARSSTGRSQVSEDFPLLSSAELALLERIGILAERHRRLRKDVAKIAANHESIQYRAVATSLQQTHLARFQQKILDVETKILASDSSLVGAYNVVPLSSIVEEFDDWHRLMAWYVSVVQFMLTPSDTPNTSDRQITYSGPALIDHLRREMQTGFSDVEKAARELVKVAETSWLRQLVPWLLYGNLPSHGQADFLIQFDVSSSDSPIIRKDLAYSPSFVTPSTASSIMFVGKTLHQIEAQGKLQNNQTLFDQNARDVRSRVVDEHLAHLSNLTFPISTSHFTQAVAAIRLSLSKNVLQQLLPTETTTMALTCLRQFFLCSRAEFAAVLLSEAQKHLTAREQNMKPLLQQDPVRAMRALPIRNAELHEIMNNIWKALLRKGDEADDDLIEFAQRHITLSTVKKMEMRPSSAGSDGVSDFQLSPTTFDDLIFLTPSSLTFQVHSPLDLFLSVDDTRIYSVISCYLLSMRRAKLGLSDLWRRADHRRQSSSRKSTKADHRRYLSSTSQDHFRSLWAACTAALFFVSEITAYFEGEVVQRCFDHFERWLNAPTRNGIDAGHDHEPHEVLPQKDPESIAEAHRAMLTSMAQRLLLTDVGYTREMRGLLSHLDSLVATATRLFSLQQQLPEDVRIDDDDNLDITGYANPEERAVLAELERTRQRVKSSLRRVLECLRELNRDGAGYVRSRVASEYIPWQGGGGLERLLVKLDYAQLHERE